MTSFAPMSDVALSGGITLFTKVMAIITGLVSVIFIMRISYLVIKVSGPSDYGDVLKDTVTFLALGSLFPVILKLIIGSINSIAQKISYLKHDLGKDTFIKFMENLFSDHPLLYVSGKLGHLFIQGLSYSVYSVLISLLIAIGPVFIFLSTMLNMSSGLKIYFGLLVSLSLWPVLWNILSQLANHVGTQFDDSPVTTFCLYVVIYGLQLISPIISYSIFKSMSFGSGAVTKVIGYGGKLWR